MIPKLAKGGVIKPPIKPVRPMEDVINILIKVKDGILKFYIENGYIYCENTKSQERVVVSTIDKKGGIV